MPSTVFDEGLQGTLAGKYGQSTAIIASRVRLYTAISPALSKDTVLANFTQVGAVMGYAAKTINSTDFAFVLDVVNHWITGTAVYTWVFTAGAGLTILGYYVTDATPAKAFEGEAFASSVVIPAAGGSLQLTISDKYKQC